jgi:ATP-binding cassette subfamily B protein
VILIAHRLSMARVAWQIVVLENAQLRAVGAHGELLNTDDLYARLVTGLKEVTYQST